MHGDPIGDFRNWEGIELMAECRTTHIAEVVCGRLDVRRTD
jgi:hypothetical protein